MIGHRKNYEHQLVDELVERLPSIHTVPSSNPSTVEAVLGGSEVQDHNLGLHEIVFKRLRTLRNLKVHGYLKGLARFSSHAFPMSILGFAQQILRREPLCCCR